MPLSTKNVGKHPPHSPLLTNAILTWSMNFVAGISPPILPLEKIYFDNTTHSKGILSKKSHRNHSLGIPLHPLFIASTQEIIGAWSALYTTGVTKKDVIASPFVHYTYDAVFFNGPLFADRSYSTDVTLVGVGAKRSGGHFLTECSSIDSATGISVCKSWWGGIVLGLQPENGNTHYLENRLAPLRPSLLPVLHPSLSSSTSSASANIETINMTVPASQAHVFDACIRDPRNPKAKSSDINVHTNVSFAHQAKLQGRTLNGMALLGISLRYLEIEIEKRQEKKNPIPSMKMRLSRVGVTFGAPVILEWETIHLLLDVLNIVINVDGKITIQFQVRTNDNGKAIKDGFFEWSPIEDLTASEQQQRGSKM